MIIDSHVHLPIEKNCLTLQQKKEKLLHDLKMNNVDKCIVITDSCMESAIGTLDECVELFRENDNVYVVGGISPFYEYQQQLNKLKTYLDEKSLVGIKLFTGHEEFYLTDKRLEKVYELAISYNVPVLFHSGWDNSWYSDVALVAELAKKYSEMKIICCHCFYPNIEKCQLLVEYPNVYFDISSTADNMLIISAIEEKIKNLIKHVLERVIFGSDYGGCSQRNHIRMVENLQLSKGEEIKIFEDNTLRVYHLM